MNRPRSKQFLLPIKSRKEEKEKQFYQKTKGAADDFSYGFGKLLLSELIGWLNGTLQSWLYALTRKLITSSFSCPPHEFTWRPSLPLITLSEMAVSQTRRSLVEKVSFYLIDHLLLLSLFCHSFTADISTFFSLMTDDIFTHVVQKKKKCHEGGIMTPSQSA